MYGRLVRDIFFPTLDLMRQRRTMNYLKELDRSQWFKREDLSDIQRVKLRALIKHAYANVPYYHRIFKEKGLKPDDIRTPKDLEKLPILTKEDIRTNLNDLAARNYNRSDLLLSSTGGSTGEPMKFYTTKLVQERNMAAYYRACKWFDFNIGDKYALLWASRFDLETYYSLRARARNLLFERRCILDALKMTSMDLDFYVQKLRKFKPKIVKGYSQSLYMLARYMEQEGVTDVQPSAVLTGAETLFDFQRKTIERAFGCPVYDGYGTRETSLYAGECTEHSGYHISVENVILEFVRNGQNVGAGELGKILITGLNNYGMPFIRYKVEDVGRPSDEVCPCGLGLPLMKSIEGKACDFVVTPSGKLLHPSFFMYLFWHDPAHYDIHEAQALPIRQYQVIQTRKDELTVKIVKEKGYENEETFAYVMDNFRRQLGNEMNIKIKFVDSIPVSRSGKRRFVISEIPLELNDVSSEYARTRVQH